MNWNLNFQLLEQRLAPDLLAFHQACLEFQKHLTAKSVLALSGPLGVGKTEFVKRLGVSRGISDVASPTFALHHRYENSKKSFDHLDLYRLQDETELDGAGFWDLFSEPEGLIVIEWPEKMNLAHIPWDWDLFLVEIQILDGNERALRFSRRIPGSIDQ